MGFYSSTGSLNVTSTDTGGRGLYSTTNLLRITLVSGVSYVGLYASDGSLNVVDSSADTTLRGLYHPSGALRGISAPSTYTGIYSPSGGLYMNGLFTIQGLFANGEQGGWYDPSDLSTLYQDAAGTTPVTGVEQPVGLVLDKSKGLVLGSELWGATSDYSAGTGTSSDVGGVITISGTDSVNRGRRGVVISSLTIGRFYQITFNVSSFSGGAAAISIASGVSNAGLLAFSTTGSYRYVYVADATSRLFTFFTGSSGASATIGSVSVRELPGSHLSQSTPTSRPVLSARVNLLTRTEDFSAAAWTTRSATATAGVITASAGAGDHDVVQSVASATGALTASVGLKSGTSSFAWVCLSPTFGLTNYATAVIDLSAGTVSKTQANGTLSISSSTISGVDAEGYRRVTFSVSSASVGVNFIIGICSSATPTISSYGSVAITAAGTETILVRKADLRPTNAGVNLPPYQRVGASTDYDTGFPLYLKFDGTDDFLVSGTINPGSVDKAQVFAGVRKLSGSSASALYEYSANALINNGAFALFADTVTPGTYDPGARQTTQWYGRTPVSFAAPITSVLTQTVDFSQIGADNALKLSVNGGPQSLSQISGGNMGQGNFLSYPLYIGRRGGTTLPANMQIYGFIVRFSAANLPDATVSNTETWMNNVTKAY